jgi:hypothetical protein
MKISLNYDNFTENEEIIDVHKYYMHGDYVYIYHPTKKICASFRLLDDNLIDIDGNTVGKIIDQN